MVFVGPDGGIVRVALKKGNIVSIDGLFGEGRSELDRLLHWKYGKVLEKELESSYQKRDILIERSKLLPLLDRILEKLVIIRDEFLYTYIAFLKKLTDPKEGRLMYMHELLKGIQGKRILYAMNKGILFINNRKVEAFLSEDSKIYENIFIPDRILYVPVSIPENAYELLKMPLFAEPELEGTIEWEVFMNIFSTLHNAVGFIDGRLNLLIVKAGKQWIYYERNTGELHRDGYEVKQANHKVVKALIYA